MTYARPRAPAVAPPGMGNTFAPQTEGIASLRLVARGGECPHHSSRSRRLPASPPPRRRAIGIIGLHEVLHPWILPQPRDHNACSAHRTRAATDRAHPVPFISEGPPFMKSPAAILGIDLGTSRRIAYVATSPHRREALHRPTLTCPGRGHRALTTSRSPRRRRAPRAKSRGGARSASTSSRSAEATEASCCAGAALLLPLSRTS